MYGFISGYKISKKKFSAHQECRCNWMRESSLEEVILVYELHIRVYSYIRVANVIMPHGVCARLLTYVRAFIFRGGSLFHHACFLLPRAMLRSYGDIAASLVQ